MTYTEYINICQLYFQINFHKCSRLRFELGQKTLWSFVNVAKVSVWARLCHIYLPLAFCSYCCSCSVPDFRPTRRLIDSLCSNWQGKTDWCATWRWLGIARMDLRLSGQQVRGQHSWQILYNFYSSLQLATCQLDFNWFVINTFNSQSDL